MNIKIYLTFLRANTDIVAQSDVDKIRNAYILAKILAYIVVG